MVQQDVYHQSNTKACGYIKTCQKARLRGGVYGEGKAPVRQEAQIIQSVKIRRGQGSADPPTSEPRSRGGDEAAEAEGINEVGCNMCERITIPKFPYRRGRQSGTLEGNIAAHRYLRDGSGSVGVAG